MVDGKMAGCVVLITGGGTGIGRSVARRCAAEGAKIAVNYSHSRSDAEETVHELERLGARAAAYRADVARDDEVRKMFAAVEADLGPVEFLVNNAGTTRFVPYRDLDAVTDSLWDEILAVNLKGAFHCARAAAEQMRKKGNGGAIVSVASAAGFSGRGSSIPYAASKGALITLTKALAAALAPEIRVNAVAPGVVETRWMDGREEMKSQSRRSTPLGRNATPEDVSEVVLSLLVSASFLTGQIILVDGGRNM